MKEIKQIEKELEAMRETGEAEPVKENKIYLVDVPHVDSRVSEILALYTGTEIIPIDYKPLSKSLPCDEPTPLVNALSFTPPATRAERRKRERDIKKGR